MCLAIDESVKSLNKRIVNAAGLLPACCGS
jgi:hypothetical protein